MLSRYAFTADESHFIPLVESVSCVVESRARNRLFPYRIEEHEREVIACRDKPRGCRSFVDVCYLALRMWGFVG